MKKIFVSIIVLGLANLLSAQGLSFGPQIGFSRVSFIEKNDFTGRIDQNFKLGWQIGAAAEFEIMSFVYLGANISFFQKGNRINYDDGAVSKLKLGYLDVPIYVGYKMPLGNISVFGNIGPYTSVAMVGKSEYESEFMDETHEVEIGGEFGYKRFDSGVAFGGGVEFKQYQIKANYSLGFVDIVPSETFSAKNSVFNITATYFIGRDF